MTSQAAWEPEAGAYCKLCGAKMYNIGAGLGWEDHDNSQWSSNADGTGYHFHEVALHGRSCCDCGDTFTPAHESARRCGSCAAVKYLG